MKDKQIIVLMGGPSEEAEVSRRTGAAIAEALVSKGYKAQTLELNPRTVLKDIDSLGGEVVFNAIHGRYGEDGALQGLLEMAEIPYTGSGIMAHAVGMNKKVSKDVFKGANIPTARSESYNGNLESAEAIIDHIRKEFTIPVVVKSATQGSSIGVTIVREESQLEAAVTEALKYDPILVGEQFLVWQQMCGHIGLAKERAEDTFLFLGRFGDPVAFQELFYILIIHNSQFYRIAF